MVIPPLLERREQQRLFGIALKEVNRLGFHSIDSSVDARLAGYWRVSLSFDPDAGLEPQVVHVPLDGKEPTLIRMRHPHN